jgi:hypothetical protein
VRVALDALAVAAGRVPVPAAAPGLAEPTSRAEDRAPECARLRLPGPHLFAAVGRLVLYQTILVEVLAKGFRYENRQYSSLSAIAVAITGTRWNGLAFFGLTRPARRKGKERLCAQR